MSDRSYGRLAGYYFFYFAFIGAFSPYFALYLQSLSFSAWDIGLLMSQMQLMRLLGPYVWGWLADHFGRRLFIVRLAGIASLAGFSCFFFLQQLNGMLVAMAILAFFWSAALPLVEALTFDHLRESTANYSRIRVWGSVGFIVAVLATGAALEFVAVSGILWVCWLILLGIFACAMLIRDVPAAKAVCGRAGSILAVVKQKHVAGFFVACFAMSAAHGALYVFYSIHLAELGFGKAAVGAFWTLGVLSEIAVFMVMARLLRNYKFRVLMLMTFAVAVVRFLLIGWGGATVLLLILAQLMHAMTFGVFHATSVAVVNAWFPERYRGRGQALYSSISFGAGGLLGGLLSGWMWDRVGAGWTYTLSSAFALFGFLVVWFVMRADAPAQGVDSGKNRNPVT
mgnify:CR=1 FL=1